MLCIYRMGVWKSELYALYIQDGGYGKVNCMLCIYRMTNMKKSTVCSVYTGWGLWKSELYALYIQDGGMER